MGLFRGLNEKTVKLPSCPEIGPTHASEPMEAPIAVQQVTRCLHVWAEVHCECQSSAIGEEFS